MDTQPHLNLAVLRAAVEAGWDSKTTYCPDQYTGQDRAFGQCAVTALVLQEWLGGGLRSGMALERGREHEPVLHYWNSIGVTGSDLDWTWRQFRPGTRLTGARPVEREALLTEEWMVARVALFRLRVSTAYDQQQQQRSKT